jgi:hypothetical protein
MADTSRARCGNDPRAQLTPGDRKAVDDFKARLALQAAVKPHLDSAVWVDGDPLMEVVAVTLWERCARDDEDMPQLVRDDPRTIAALAAAVARAHAASTPTDQTALRDRIAAALITRIKESVLPETTTPQFLGGNTSFFAATEYDLADVVLALLPAPVDRAAELLALATVLEIPRPGTGTPLQLRRSYGHADRWAICDRTGRRWHREHGWVYEPDGIRDEAQRDATRYALAEAVPLARQLADETSDAETQDVPRRDPHPTEADVRHALRVRDFFEGRDTTPAADEA